MRETKGGGRRDRGKEATGARRPFKSRELEQKELWRHAKQV